MARKWLVVDDNGNVVADRCSEGKAKEIAGRMQEKEPEAGWEAICGDDEEGRFFQ